MFYFISNHKIFLMEYSIYFNIHYNFYINIIKNYFVTKNECVLSETNVKQ